MKKIIKIYQSKNGKRPFVEWIDAIKKKDKKASYRILDRINRIIDSGEYGDVKPLGDGIYELRFFLVKVIESILEKMEIL
jgi:putative component of toxin-antitoxin plasmid stabilization module